MAKASKKLKSALQSQQSRLKNKKNAVLASEQKAKKAQSTHQQPKKKDKGKGKAVDPPTRRPTIPFHSNDMILLIGEGNFSFARALVTHDTPSLPPRNITATAYDSEKECYAKYPEAEGIVGCLREQGAEVLFGIDATRLDKISALKGRHWDRVVWNFPHAGKGISDQDRNILSNQMLILGFLRSSAGLLKQGPLPSIMAPTKKKEKPDDDDGEEDNIEEAEDEEDMAVNLSEIRDARGTVLITLRNVSPYTLWDVTRLAKNPPPPTGSAPPNPKYTLLRSFAFHRSIWSGYEHRMTKGERAHGTGTTGKGGEDRTWEFCLRD